MCDVAERIENKGRSQERKDIIANMLSSGKTAEEISSFVGIPLEEVKEVEASMCAKA